MIRAEFQANRASFPRAELEKYRGLWVAFSSNGVRIVAAGKTLEEADRNVLVAGEDPNFVMFERVPGPDDDVCFGSEEFR
jgi:hypothetical protein